MKSDSQLCMLTPLLSSSLPLSFVNRWVEVSDCDESQSKKKRDRQTNRLIHVVLNTSSHSWLLKCTLAPAERCNTVHASLLSVSSFSSSYLHIL